MIYAVPRIGPEETAALERIEVVRSHLRYFVAEPRRWVGMVRRVLAARAIQGSNSIEGYHVSVEDAVAAIEGAGPAEVRDEDWDAVLGYRRALTYVIQLARDDHFAYSAALIRSLHFMMTEHSLDAGPGLWRPGAIWIRNDHTGEIVYQAPDHELVPGLVEELVEQLQELPGIAAPVRAAMAHLNLAMIHPFRDGNGRMARCLQTLVLAREGILAPELSSIEEYLGANTQAYYDVLAEVGHGAWHPEREARPWVRFCLTAHFVQATSVLRRMNESERISLALDELIVEHRLQTRCASALFDAAIGLRVRNASYRAALKGWNEELSHATATTDLAALVKAGLLDKQGEKRGTYYVAAQPLLDIRKTYMRGRQSIDTTHLFDPVSPSSTEPELPFGTSSGSDGA